METSTIIDSGEIYTWRTCPTCIDLLDNHKYSFFDEDYLVFPSGCVFEYCLEKNMTPEELLIHLNS